MAYRRVIVDGSNIATEGRSVPSLSQLDEAVREFQREHPEAEVTVVVDASFGHRIDQSDRKAFEEAEAHGEIVSPPAGAIGRGDAFLLRIAEKTGATVLSNDSFQEFHGEHEWLFSDSRLVGGKPVPGVGWIFTPRTPVRGPRSRVATKDARRTRVRIGSKEASQPMPVPSAPPPSRGRRGGGAKKAEKAPVLAGGATPPADPQVRQAIAAATKEVVSPEGSSSGQKRRRRGAGPPPQAVNDPLTFITFIAEHALGEQVEGEVESFTSHGAFVRIGEALAYVPVAGLGDPPPRSARRVLRRREHRAFVLQALDPQRRGVELALPQFAHVAGSPREETVEAEISEATGTEESLSAEATVARGRRPEKARATKAKQRTVKVGSAAGAAKGAKGRSAGPVAKAVGGLKARTTAGKKATRASKKTARSKARERAAKAPAKTAKAQAKTAKAQAKTAKSAGSKASSAKKKATATKVAATRSAASKTASAKKAGAVKKTKTARTTKASKTARSAATKAKARG
jgi:hypothetical protein